MSLVVQKFGGSSVATPEMIHQVAAGLVKTRREGHDVVVVVSAMGKTTDELLDLATRVNEDPARRELDLLLASGEQVSSSLLAMAVQSLGEKAVALTGAQSGILTSGVYGAAKVRHVRPDRIREELARGRIVIVAGFQGAASDSELTTLGRGGSDTSAVALAGALNADVCEICTDVDGVFSADPRVVEDARRLDVVHYDEMLALAQHGARVLHVEAVELARQHNIRLRVRATFGSDGGTWVGVHDRKSAGEFAAGVASRKDLLGVSGQGEGVRERVVEQAMEATASEHDVMLRESAKSSSNASADRFELLITGENLPDTESFAESLSRSHPDVQVTPGLGTVAAVGRELSRRDELLETFQSVPAPVLGHYACPVSMSCIVPEKHVDETSRALHEILVQPGFRAQEALSAVAS